MKKVATKGGHRTEKRRALLLGLNAIRKEKERFGITKMKMKKGKTPHHLLVNHIWKSAKTLDA